MEWELTLDELQIVAVMLSLICYTPVGIWMIKYNISFFSQKRFRDISKDSVWACVFGIALINAPIFVLITSNIPRIIFAIGEILIFSLYISIAKNIIPKFSESKATVNDKATVGSEKLTKNLKISQAITALMGCSLMYLAVFPLLLWAFPDVAYVTKDGNTFHAKLRYEIPYTHGFKPGDSYIVNDSPDTLLRVIVRYAYPERDKGNVYGVTAKYPPHSTTRMTDKADYIMRQIPLYLPPTSSRTGKHPTKKVFIVDKEQLWDFRVAKMQRFGLNRNREVDRDSISEPTNKTVIDTKLKDMPTSGKSSFYNYHYDGR